MPGKNKNKYAKDAANKCEECASGTNVTTSTAEHTFASPRDSSHHTACTDLLEAGGLKENIYSKLTVTNQLCSSSVDFLQESSDLMSRMKSFLPQIEAANKELYKQLETGEGPGQLVEIEHEPRDSDTDDEGNNEGIIEMNVAIFPLADSSSSSSSDSDDDTETKPAIEVINSKQYSCFDQNIDE